jgi:small subunit ribosomal protein S6
MATEAPIYDLTLLLSTDADEDQRKKVLADVETAITTAGGSIERNDDWGRRPLAYEIRHQPEAEYHLLQFRAPGAMIEELSHTLRITDGVLRFRVIKVRPGTPPAPSSPPPVVAAATPSGHGPGAASAAAPAAAIASSDAESGGEESGNAESAGAGSSGEDAAES